MTTNNNSEETRMFNEQSNEETQRIESTDEATRMATVENDDEEATRLNPAAPASRRAMSKSQWASRLGFGIGGAALGFGAGYAVSANASTTDKSVTGLAPGATPENEMTPEKKADSVPSDRERTVIEDPNDMPASTINEVKATEEPIEVQPVISDQSHNYEAANAHAAAHTASTAGKHDNHIVDDNPVGNTAHVEHPAEQPVEVTVGETTAEGTIPNQSDVILTNDHGIRYAHVDDDMSFGEAFAAAREQVGAPGVFEWHGNTYGTYYAEEWNDMSVADRSEFIHNVDFPEDLNREAPVEDIVVEPQIEVLEVSSSMTADGSVTNAAHMTVDGTDVYMVDVDGDRIMDVAVIDVDGDGMMNEEIDTIIPLEDQNITMNDVVAVMNPDITTGAEPAMDPMTEMPTDDDMAMNDFESETLPDF